MKNFILLGTGSAMALISGIGVLTGGFNSAGELGGVNLNLLGLAFSATGAGLSYLGYRGVKKEAAAEAANKASAPAPKV